MSFNDQTFQCINMMPATIRDHFDRMSSKIKVCDEKLNKELKMISQFLKDLQFIGSVYEKSLFKLCEDFQLQMKHYINDEKLSQYYQLVINSLLRHGDAIQKQYEQVGSVWSNFNVIDKDFHMTSENIIKSVGSSLSFYKDKSQEFELLYRKYTKSSSSISNQANPRGGRGSGSDLSEFNSARDAEDQALVCFADLRVKCQRVLFLQVFEVTPKAVGVRF